MKYSHVAIIVPTYNERENILFLLEKLKKIVPEALLIVADDASPDGSAQAIVKKFGKDTSIFVSNGKGKSGRGAAVLRGFSGAYTQKNIDIFIEMDADHSHDPKLLPELIQSVNKNTVVCASRYIRGGKIVGWSRLRITFSWLANKLIFLMGLSSLLDNTNGFRAYPRDAVKKLLKKPFLTKNYLVLTESAAILKSFGFHFVEIPSHFHNRTAGKSKTSLHLAASSLFDLMRLWWRYG